MSFSSRARASASSIFLPSNLIVWLSAIVVLGIVAYWFSAQNQQPDSIVYMLVVSILTVVFFLAAFLLEGYLGFHLLFNLIFSYLWLAVVVFAASMFSHASKQAQAVEAFSFLAFFGLLFNVGYIWYTAFPPERAQRSQPATSQPATATATV